MAEQKTPFIGDHSLFYPLDSLEALFGVVKATSKKGFFEKLAKLESSGQEGLSIGDIKKMIHIGLNFDPSDKVSVDQASKLTNEYYSENGYDALESLLFDAFADSGLFDKKAREDGKRYIEERKRLISEQKFLELQELENDLADRQKKLEGEDKGEVTLITSQRGNG